MAAERCTWFFADHRRLRLCQEGTFDAIIARLGYLKDLGVTHIELMPTAEFSGDRGWGYDGVDLFAPHHIYGGPGALKRLVNACHQHGLAVLIDVVFNHFGPSGNYLPRFGPYHTNRYRTPWGKAVNFADQGSAEVRRFLCDSALMWLREYHCDGLRIDAVHEIFDRSAIHFLEQLSSEVRSLEAHLGRRLCLIAESDLNDPRVVRATEVGGYGIDAQWNDDFHHALHAYITGERSGYYLDFGSLGDVATALSATKSWADSSGVKWPSVRWVSAEPRSGGQSREGRANIDARQFADGQNRFSIGLCRAVCADALSG